LSIKTIIKIQGIYGLGPFTVFLISKALDGGCTSANALFGRHGTWAD